MRRDWLTLAFGLGLVGAVVWLSLRENISHQLPTPPPAPQGAESSAVLTPEASEAPPAPAEVPQERTAAPTATTARTARVDIPLPAASTQAGDVALYVQSDIPGASVFLDREFVGTTPMALRGLTLGSRQLNVTATGHEGYASSIDLVEGANRINVEFLKVRINASVPVIHRHAMGSCRGTLAATPKGLAYDTVNKPDAFAMPFAELEEFEIDSLRKNLRVRRRGGKTWNFTNETADTLFVFHKDVVKARERIAATP